MVKVTISAVYIPDSLSSYFKVILLTISNYLSTNIFRNTELFSSKRKVNSPSGLLGQPFIPRCFESIFECFNLTMRVYHSLREKVIMHRVIETKSQ